MSWVGGTGYAIAAQGYLLALIGAGESVGWTPLFPRDPELGGWSQAPSTAEAQRVIDDYCDHPGDPESYNGSIARAAVDRLGDDEAEVVILHVVPESWAEHRGKERFAIGNTVWETDKLPHHWPQLLNDVDSLIVPCEMNRDVMIRGGVTRPIHVIGHVAPRFGPPPRAEDVAAFRQAFGIPDEGTVFYCCDDWTPRKAPAKTISAFLRAFSSTADVTLVVKTGPYGARSGAEPDYHLTTDLVAELVDAQPDPPRVIVIPGELPRRAVEILHGLGDCYVSLTHGEGWGLGAYEAAASGNPVITTGWGGTLDYLGTDWPYLVDFDLVPVMYLTGMPSFDPTQRWAAADLSHAVSLMREFHRDPESARRAVAAVRERINSDYNLEATAVRLKTALNP